MWDEVIDIWDETNCSVMCMRGKEKIEFARRYMMKENHSSARELEKFLDLKKGTIKEKKKKNAKRVGENSRCSGNQRMVEMNYSQ